MKTNYEELLARVKARAAIIQQGNTDVIPSEYASKSSLPNNSSSTANNIIPTNNTNETAVRNGKDDQAVSSSHDSNMGSNSATKGTELPSSAGMQFRQSSERSQQGIEETEGANSYVTTNVVRDVHTATDSSSSISNKTISSQRKLAGVERDIILNDKQQQFLDTVLTGKNVVLIGAAGTGKTTSVNKVSSSLLEKGHITNLVSGTKYLQAGKPGIVVVSYTRKAVSNIKKAVVSELRSNVITLHKLLEFQPVFYEIEDPNNAGQFKKTMHFEPNRNASNPLPQEISLVIFEESSMIGIELYNQLQEALPHLHQEVFLGDIQQLPPVFGQAVLGYKMLSQPVIELTEVYRQALNSPIISLAWSILNGESYKFDSTKEVYIDKQTKKPRYKVPALEDMSKSTEFGTVKFQVWQKKLSQEEAIGSLRATFKNWFNDGYYDPNEDIILIPFNKDPGTIELNKHIQQFLGDARTAKVYEIQAGFNKHYLAVGDRVLYDKEDAFIVSIRKNGTYTGKSTQEASIHLNRWGHYDAPLEQSELEDAAGSEEERLEAMEKFFENAALEQDTRVQEASHTVGIVYAHSYDSELEYQEESINIITLTKAADINNLLGGNCITVHKFQGSENSRVFFIMTHHHSIMNQRELLYTAVTRASNVLHIICEPDTFEKGIKSQKIKGNTIAEKSEAFKGKGSNTGAVEELKFTEERQIDLYYSNLFASLRETEAGFNLEEWNEENEYSYTESTIEEAEKERTREKTPAEIVAERLAIIRAARRS